MNNSSQATTIRAYLERHFPDAVIEGPDPEPLGALRFMLRFGDGLRQIDFPAEALRRMAGQEPLPKLLEDAGFADMIGTMAADSRLVVERV